MLVDIIKYPIILIPKDIDGQDQTKKPRSFDFNLGESPVNQSCTETFIHHPGSVNPAPKGENISYLANIYSKLNICGGREKL